MLSHSRVRHLTALPTPGGTWHSVQETVECRERSQDSPAARVALQDEQYAGVSVAHTGMTTTTATTTTKATTTSDANHVVRYHLRGTGS